MPPAERVGQRLVLHRGRPLATMALSEKDGSRLKIRSRVPSEPAQVSTQEQRERYPRLRASASVLCMPVVCQRPRRQSHLPSGSCREKFQIGLFKSPCHLLKPGDQVQENLLPRLLVYDL